VAYAAAFLTLLLARWPARFGVPLLLAHLLLAAVALLAPRARDTAGLGAFLGEFYPVLVLLPLYTAVGLVNTGAGVSHDAVVQRWERTLFGFEPSLSWVRAQPWPWLSRLLHLGYLSFYPIVVGVPLGLWLARRRDGARVTLRLVMITFYVCYVLFLLFPVAGPRTAFPLADNEATRTEVAAFTRRLLGAGSAWGTAFPSSHVAVALVASVSAGRAWAGHGAPLLAATGLLALGTVYGQFHYALDVLAGAALGAAMLAAHRSVLRCSR
jgi:membrane-associated phospholipid phosphatase